MSRRRRVKPLKIEGGPFSPSDPFGLLGLDLRRESLTTDGTPKWFAEMRSALEQRWEAVEELHRKDQLDAEMKKRTGRELSPEAAQNWFQDSKEDHYWRVRLLDPKSGEGRTYAAYMRYRLENGLHGTAPHSGPDLEQDILFLLDLDEGQDPFGPPVLCGYQDVVERWVRSGRKGDRTVSPYQKKGLLIPRRFGRDRACRLVADFVRSRSEDYWRQEQSRLQARAEKARRGFPRQDKKLLAKQVGDHTVALANALLDPMVQLGRRTINRGTPISESQKKEALALYDKWYPIVKKLRTVKTAHAIVGKAPRRVLDLYNSARRQEDRPQRITLQMILDDLNIQLGVDAFWRRLKPRGKRSVRKQKSPSKA